MFLEEPYSELARQIPTLPTDSRVPGWQVVAGLLNLWNVPRVPPLETAMGWEMEQKQGETE